MLIFAVINIGVKLKYIELDKTFVEGIEVIVAVGIGCSLVAEAEDLIQKYFDRKIRQGKLTDDGATTRKTDDKSKNRIHVMQDAMKSIEEMRQGLKLEREKAVTRRHSKGSVNVTSFDEMLNESGAVHKKSTKRTSVNTNVVANSNTKSEVISAPVMNRNGLF